MGGGGGWGWLSLHLVTLSPPPDVHIHQRACAPPLPLSLPLLPPPSPPSQVQPWTYDRGLDFPGTALADRLDDKGNYLNAPSTSAQQYADMYSEAAAALGPDGMKHLKDVLSRVENPDALGKQ